jgi:cytochrome c oxidase subunit 4
MLVAFVKASLVVAYFMHLKYDDKYHLFVFAGTIIFVGIFFGFTMYDMQVRDRLNDEQETFVRVRDMENAGNAAQGRRRQRPGAGRAHPQGGRGPRRPGAWRRPRCGCW